MCSGTACTDTTLSRLYSLTTSQPNHRSQTFPTISSLEQASIIRKHIPTQCTITKNTSFPQPLSTASWSPQSSWRTSHGSHNHQFPVLPHHFPSQTRPHPFTAPRRHGPRPILGTLQPRNIQPPSTYKQVIVFPTKSQEQEKNGTLHQRNNAFSYVTR